MKEKDGITIYDLIININSIKGILNGWDIKYSKVGKEKANYSKRNPTKIFSVIGNKDRGKSFILSKIAKRNLPSGFSVATKGLSISFPTFDNIALLDSVGFESPLLECDGEDYILKSEKKEENKKTYEILGKLKEDIKKLKQNSQNIFEIRDKENEFFRIRNEFRNSLSDKENQIYSLTNERRITDFFLQRFIIENANVLLLVVGKLSIDDQFFLNKLTRLIKDNHKQFLQKIIVVHNLMTMKNKKTVEDYIKNTLERSLTFTLIKKEDLYLKNKNKNQYNRIRFVEKNEDSTEKEIVHLIMAQDGTEAGDYYNESTIEAIRKTGKIIVNAKPFDIVDKLKTYFSEVSETILKFETNEKIKPDDIKLDEKNQKLKLDYKKELKLETFYGDLISDTFGDPKFTPTYHIISNDPDYLKIYLDCPGKTSINDVDITYPNQTTIVIIKGNREKQNKKALGKKFGSGDFELKILLKGSDGDVTNNITLEPPIDGFYRIRIEREKKIGAENKKETTQK